MKSYPFSSSTYHVGQLANELVAAGVPMGGEGRIVWNSFPVATSIVIWTQDNAVDAAVNATVAAHSPPSSGPPASHAHSASDVTGTAVLTNDSRLSDARTPTAHTHPQSEVTGLVSDLAGKAASGHVHAAADVTSGVFDPARLGIGATGTKFLRGDSTFQTIAGGGDLLSTNNLSDLLSATVARANLGLGTAAVTAVTDYATAAQGVLAATALQAGGNLGAATSTSLTATGGIASTGTAGIGYATGAGGAVTQLTNKSTGVTINKTCGRITMHGAALAAAAEVNFLVTNSTVAATDVVVVCVQSVGTVGRYFVTVGAVSAGSFSITVGNCSTGSLSQALVLNFAVIKGVSA